MKALVLALSLAAMAAPATAAEFLFQAALDQNEPTPTGSPGTGHAVLRWDDVLHEATLRMTWSGLVSPTTVSHIHAPTAVANTGAASVATTVPSFPGFPAGVFAGNYFLRFDTDVAGSYNPAFVTASGGTVAGAETRLLNALIDEKAYINIHTVMFGSGEIRGFFAQVPEPATWAMMILGFAGVGGTLRRRRAALA